MRIALILACLLVSDSLSAQTAPATAAPAPTRKPQPAPSRAGMALTVTDARGGTLAGIQVEADGPSDRSGETNTSGQINFTAMQPGTYRVRFSGDEVITFEREILVRAGQVASADIVLTPAPPPERPAPADPPPPAPAAAPAVGPMGKPQTLAIVDLVEEELIDNNEARRDTLIACSGNTRTTLIQLNQDQSERLYDSAEVTYYVVAGEGAVRLGGRDSALIASSFVSVPRGTAHSIIRRGRRPLIVLATLSGAPCEQAR